MPLILPFTLIIFSFLLQPHQLPAQPDPDQQPFNPTQTQTQPTTIPSFPEQSTTTASICPLNLPTYIFPPIQSSCSGPNLRHSLCCPLLASYLYSSYSQTALGLSPSPSSMSSNNNMPLLPDDSETCGDKLEKEMRNNGVDLVRPNVTCDVVYCFCGIRLHPLSCPQAFWVQPDGSLGRAKSVTKLEKNCLSGNNHNHNHNGTKINANGGDGLVGCSKCLKSLYRLKKGEIRKGYTTKVENRTTKMRSRDCELMGLTWLLNKDRDAYISTVTSVMRALMVNTQDSDLASCSRSSNGMPLAVDSIEIDGQSESLAHHFSFPLYLFSLFLVLITGSYCF